MKDHLRFIWRHAPDWETRLRLVVFTCAYFLAHIGRAALKREPRLAAD